MTTRATRAAVRPTTGKGAGSGRQRGTTGPGVVDRVSPKAPDPAAPSAFHPCSPPGPGLPSAAEATLATLPAVRPARRSWSLDEFHPSSCPGYRSPPSPPARPRPHVQVHHKLRANEAEHGSGAFSGTALSLDQGIPKDHQRIKFSQSRSPQTWDPEGELPNVTTIQATRSGELAVTRREQAGGAWPLLGSPLLAEASETLQVPEQL